MPRLAECQGFGKPNTASIPRPCPYPATGVLEIEGIPFDVCYWHDKTLRGLITDAGAGRELSWPTKPRMELERQPADTLMTLLREWA